LIFEFTQGLIRDLKAKRREGEKRSDKRLEALCGAVRAILEGVRVKSQPAFH